MTDCFHTYDSRHTTVYCTVAAVLRHDFISSCNVSDASDDKVLV
jgi:hypothetical protein